MLLYTRKHLYAQELLVWQCITVSIGQGRPVLNLTQIAFTVNMEDVSGLGTHVETALTAHASMLQLERGATERDVKKAYRQLSLIYHPDKNPDPAAATYFAEFITKAYKTLTGRQLPLSLHQVHVLGTHKLP